MKKGARVETPRFCTVKIEEVFETRTEAMVAGFTEPTFYEDSKYGILGKSLDQYHMEFAAFRKKGK